MPRVEQAIERHIVDLRRYARSLSTDRDDADELVQECLVRALSRPQFWDNIRDPRAYLLTILHNVYVDGRSIRKRYGGHVAIEDVMGRLSRPAPQPAYLELRDVARAMTALPPEQRRAVRLVGLGGMSYQEAADEMGVPLGTVMSRLSRARESLRRMMSGERRAGGKPN